MTEHSLEQLDERLKAAGRREARRLLDEMAIINVAFAGDKKAWKAKQQELTQRSNNYE